MWIPCWVTVCHAQHWHCFTTMCLPHFHPLLIAYFFQTCLIPPKNFRVFTWTGRGIKWPVQRRIRFPLKGVLGVNGALGAPRARAPKELQFGEPFGAHLRHAQGTFHAEDPFQRKLCYRLCFFRGFYLDWLLYRGILCWGRVYKVANPT